MPHSKASSTQVKACNDKDKDKPQDALVGLRLSIYEAFVKLFAATYWNLPTQKEALIKDCKYEITRKDNKENGIACDMYEESMTFKLKTDEPNSVEALGKAITGYIEAYTKWQERHHKDDKAYDLYFELKTEHKNDVKDIIRILKDVPLKKVEFKNDKGELEVMPADEIKKIRQEIADEKKTVAKPTDKPVAKPAAKTVAKPVAKPTDKPVAKPAAKTVTKPIVKPTDKPVVKPAAKTVTKPTAKLVADTKKKAKVKLR